MAPTGIPRDSTKSYKCMATTLMRWYVKSWRWHAEVMSCETQKSCTAQVVPYFIRIPFIYHVTLVLSIQG